MNTLQKHIEAILLVHGEPITLKKLAATLKEKEPNVQQAVKELQSGYLEEERGFAIIENKATYQLVSSPDSSQYVQRLIRQEKAEILSPAMLETLSIVAYCGPVTRVEVESIRGVNCSHTLRSLAKRGLVDRAEDPEDIRTYRYSASFVLLRHLGINHLSELPDYETFSKNTKTETLQTEQ